MRNHIGHDTDGQEFRRYTLDTDIFHSNYIRKPDGQEIPVAGLDLDGQVKKYAEDKNLAYDEALIEYSRNNPDDYKAYVQEKKDFDNSDDIDTDSDEEIERDRIEEKIKELENMLEWAVTETQKDKIKQQIANYQAVLDSPLF